MKPDKKIFLIISVFVLIAVTCYATPTIDLGLIFDSYNYFDHNNIGLFIDDHQLNPDHETQPVEPEGGTYEFVLRFNNATSENKATYTSDMEVFSLDNSSNNSESWQYVSIASSSFVTAYCDTKPGNNFPEGADMDLLAAELSKMEEPGGTVNLFWTLPNNKGPSRSLSTFNFRE
ncbi:hypothetical protein QUF80_10255 [Desulfococcaceae bacterium HSG8]|nr:hypothetical protein [Desulfococcaceae bacterium HSG8]